MTEEILRLKIIFQVTVLRGMSRNLKSPQQLVGRFAGVVGLGLAFYGVSNSIYNGNFKIFDEYCVHDRIYSS